MSSRMKAKTRAIAHLQRIRDATLDIFRNIQQTSRLQHEDEWKERSELLAQNRERLLAILQITQNQLTTSVTELKSHNAHKSRVDELQRHLEEGEKALSQYGDGLIKAENVLRKELAAVGPVAARRRHKVTVPVDDLVGYAHLISYTTSAREGWEPNTPLSNSLPPAPHVSSIAQSRLFTRQHRANKRPLEAQEGPQADDSRYIRMWKHPQHQADGDEAALMPPEEAMKPLLGAQEEPSPSRRAIPFSIPVPLQKDSPGRHMAESSLGADGIVTLQRPKVVLPSRPPGWRPGDAISVSGSDIARPTVAAGGGSG